MKIIHLYETLQATMKNQNESQLNKTKLLGLVLQKSKNISFEDLILLSPRSCQNFVSELLVTNSTLYKQLLSNFFKEDSEGGKVYILKQISVLTNEKQGFLKQLMSRSYHYLQENNIQIENEQQENLNDNLDPLIVYYKLRQKDQQNPYHKFLYQAQHIETFLQKGIKQYLFKFIFDQDGTLDILMNSNSFYLNSYIDFNNQNEEYFTNQLCEYLDEFLKQLQILQEPFQQLQYLLIGCKLIYQLNQQSRIKDNLKKICQSFSKQFINHYLFVYNNFHQLMIKFIQQQFESFKNGILQDFSDNIQISISAYLKYYQIKQIILSNNIIDQKKQQQFIYKDFISYYFMYDVLYLKLNEITKNEELILIVDHYRQIFKQKYQNILIKQIFIVISTKITMIKGNLIDPYKNINYQKQSFQDLNLQQRFNYYGSFNWQIRILNILHDININPNIIKDTQYCQIQINSIKQSYSCNGQFNLIQKLFLNILEQTTSVTIIDYILFILTEMDKSFLFKHFAILIYKYCNDSEYNTNNRSILEELQRFLGIAEYNVTILELIKMIKQWKMEIGNQKDKFVQAIEKCHWKNRKIGLAFFRQGNLIESIYYLELYLCENQYLFKMENNKLNEKQQKKVKQLLLYIDKAKEYLGQQPTTSNMWNKLGFTNDDGIYEFCYQGIKQKQKIIEDMNKKIIPLNIDLIKLNKLIYSSIYLSMNDKNCVETPIYQLIAEISKYNQTKEKEIFINDCFNYIQRSLSLSLTRTSLENIKLFYSTSQILIRLQNYWNGIIKKDYKIIFDSNFSEHYWLYMNTLLKKQMISNKIDKKMFQKYREDLAKWHYKKFQFDQALKICKKHQNNILCKIYAKLEKFEKAIWLTDIDCSSYILSKGQFIYTSQECHSKLKFLQYLIQDSLYHRERVLNTYNDIWQKRFTQPFSEYFSNQKKLCKFSYNFAIELEKQYKYNCDCNISSQSTCFLLFDIYLTCITSNDKYIEQSFPKVFRIWYNHSNKELFARKFESQRFSAQKLQYCLELLITGVETFKNDKSASQCIAQSLCVLTVQYTSQMIWWLAPLKHFNSISKHKQKIYYDILNLMNQDSKKIIEDLEKLFSIILKICILQPKNQNNNSWSQEILPQQLVQEFNNSKYKICYPGIDNLSIPFKKEQELIKIINISKEYKIAPSKDKPKKIQCILSNQEIRYLLLKNESCDQKNNGDTRREQRIIQMLQFFNGILSPLKFPLFASISLNQMNQAIEWMNDTKTCREAINNQSQQAKNRKIYSIQEFDQLQSIEPKLNQYFFLQYQDPQEWYQAQQNFITTMALWSAFQYLIGFGDRHCDNILIHKNGEIIHIDYECVFHKGKNLPVPEIVDFRLTKNFKYAMGYLREYGLFQQILEQILKTFQNRKADIIAYLDPYIYDPLLCKTSENVIQLLEYKLDNQIDVIKLIERNTCYNVLRQMYFGWAPYL